VRRIAKVNGPMLIHCEGLAFQKVVSSVMRIVWMIARGRQWLRVGGGGVCRDRNVPTP
jgi:hypothetical protein